MDQNRTKKDYMQAATTCCDTCPGSHLQGAVDPVHHNVIWP
jgi:hypothetical protein